MKKALFLISRSREGGIAANAARRVGAAPIRGSAAKGGADKGGFEAGRELVRLIESGRTAGVTPDGPRGPRMRARLGPVNVARLAQAGARIYELPISYDGRSYAEGKKIGWKDGVSALWAIVKYNLLPPRARPWTPPAVAAWNAPERAP